METSFFEPESNAAHPLIIVKKETQEISSFEYCKGSNLKHWDIQQIIKDRVNKEAEVI